MSAEQPMTAAKMLDDLLSPRGDELWSERVYHILVRMLEWMSTSEREHAELLARVERLEAKVMGDGR